MFGDLKTNDEDALRLVNAKNEAERQPVINNLQIARAYLMVSDPAAATRRIQDRAPLETII